MFAYAAPAAPAALSFLSPTSPPDHHTTTPSRPPRPRCQPAARREQTLAGAPTKPDDLRANIGKRPTDGSGSELCGLPECERGLRGRGDNSDECQHPHVEPVRSPLLFLIAFDSPCPVVERLGRCALHCICFEECDTRGLTA
ncbi:hypothetical protein PMIN02_008445 [Paraphaeosphaeria minitans]